MSMSQEEIDSLIKSQKDEDIDLDATEDESSESKEEEIKESSDKSYADSKLELLYDLQLPVTIELGRTNMLIRDILKLGRGSVIEFDKLVSEPVDILANGKKIAEGEVVVIDKHFGIRITTLVDPSERLRGLKK